MVVSWIWLTKSSTTFWPRNWASGKFVQSWFQKTTTNKRKAEGMCTWTFLSASKMKIFQTCHNRWRIDYDAQIKRQSSEWRSSNSPRPKKRRMSKSKIKPALICFFDSQDVQKEFVPQIQTVNKRYCREVLERLRLRTLGCWITTKLPITLPSPWTNFWPKRVFQWPRSPHLSPCDFLFSETEIPPKMSFWNCGQHPKGRDRPAEGTSTWRLQHCYREWKQHLRRCVVSQGNFEGIMLICSSVVNNTFYSTSLITF